MILYSVTLMNIIFRSMSFLVESLSSFACRWGWAHSFLHYLCPFSFILQLWLTYMKCFQFSLIENTVSYWFIIYRLYYIVIQSISITSAASGRATQGLERSPTWGSELTHRHPQIQKGLLSSAENRVIKYHALNSQNLSPVCIWPSLSLWLSLLSVSYPDTVAESPEALSFVFVSCFQVPRGDVTW